MIAISVFISHLLPPTAFSISNQILPAVLLIKDKTGCGSLQYQFEILSFELGPTTNTDPSERESLTSPSSPVSMSLLFPTSTSSFSKSCPLRIVSWATQPCSIPHSTTWTNFFSWCVAITCPLTQFT